MPAREIIVIPTTHRDEGIYTADALASVLVSHAPQVVFVEAPADTWEEESALRACEWQEYRALAIARKSARFDIVPVDLLHRDEFARGGEDAEIPTFSELDKLLERVVEAPGQGNIRVSRIARSLERRASVVDTMIEGVARSGLPYLLSSRFRRIVAEKDRLLDKAVSLCRGPEAEKLRRLHAAAAHFHGETRDGAIAMNCLRVMERRERGVLLIGAEHLGIVGCLRRICRGRGISARWVRTSEPPRAVARGTPFQRPDHRR